MSWSRDGQACHDKGSFGTQIREIEAYLDRTLASVPKQKEIPMKIITKVIESMLTKDATQTWTGQTSAVASRGWSWGGYTEQSRGWSWGGFSE